MRDFAGNWFSQGRSRMQRGDMSPLILHVLAEKPMHGYEIIRTFEERSHGIWRPSAGSIYPTLQMLEEQGLVMSQEIDGKKVYSLTEKGQKQSEEQQSRRFEWAGHKFAGRNFGDMAIVAREIMMSLKHIAFQGDAEQLQQAKAILNEMKDRLADLARHSHQK